MTRGKRYAHMTPEDQRRVDERDLAILRMLQQGATYAEIERAMGVTAPTVARVKKILDE